MGTAEINFKLKKTRVVFRGRVFNVQVDEIEYNSGNPGIRETVVHPGGAVVVPVTDQKKILMVTQYRYPLQKIVLELPAGKLDDGEDPFSCAVRELEEETGYKADNVEKLGAICTSPGFCTEILHIYIATGLKAGKHRRDEGEYGMEISGYDIPELEEKIMKGEIIDAKSVCGIYYAKKFIEENRPL